MNATIQPSIISGELYAPASKSSMQRACAAALLNKGITKITLILPKSDFKIFPSFLVILPSIRYYNNNNVIANATQSSSLKQHWPF